MSKQVKQCKRDINIRLPYFCLVTSEEEFYKQVKKYNIKSTPLYSDGLAHTYSYKFDNCIVCIVSLGNVEKYSSIEVASFLVHEAVHVWQAYCSFIGEDKPGSEQEAYVIEHISRELFESYSKKLGDTNE